MNADQAVKLVRGIQQAFLVVALLRLTAYYLPEDTNLEDCMTFDFIVIGAGTAGAVVASRLVEDSSTTVLLIEAGKDPPLESEWPTLFPFVTDSIYDWNQTAPDDGFTAQFHQNQYLFLPQGKMLGGTSSLNHLVYNRGSPHDYNAWAEVINDESWNFANLLPYFKKFERLEDSEILNSYYKQFHGTEGSIGISREPHNVSQHYIKSFQELGHKYILDSSGYDTLGFGEPLFVISGGVRQSTAYSFLRIVKDFPNLYVAKNTQATEILFDENNNAIGVKVIKNGVSTTIEARKEVILSCGAFNSPQLLMLSGIGPKEHLDELGIPVRSDLPVGKNYQDHVGVMSIFKMKKIGQPSPTNPHEFPLPAVIGYVALNGSQSYPDYQSLSFIFDSPEFFIQMCSFVLKFKYETCNALYNASVGHEIFFGVPNDLHPKSRGEVLLKSTNASDLPIVRTGFFSDEEDLDRMVTFIKDYYQVINTTYFKESDAEFMTEDLLDCNDMVFGTEEYWRCYALSRMVSLSCYCGTCSMGSVVDSRLRVIGVQNLRVVDASVIPNVTSGNIMAPVVMLGEKGADMIKEDNGIIC